MVRSVWHGHEKTRTLKEMVRAYETFTRDTNRTMLRIKAIYRSRGIRTEGSGVYQATQRQQWLGKIGEAGMRQRAAWLYEQLDHVRKLRKQAKAGMLAESRTHRAIALLRSIPQLGPVRSAQIVATADTPYRFRTKRQFWSHSGLGVVTHSSAEYCGGTGPLGNVCPAPEPSLKKGLMALRGWSRCTIFGSDANRSNKFYQDLFGWHVQGYQAPAGSTNSPFLNAGNGVEFLMFGGGGGGRGGAAPHRAAASITCA